MHCISLESKYGVPAIPVVVDVFKDLVKEVAFAKGMPELRFAFVPNPVMGKSNLELQKYVEGNDPVTGRQLMDGIVDALTRPSNAKEKKTGAIERTIPRFEGPDTRENLNSIFLENGWTDKLPIVLPTEKRVAEMLKGTSRKPDEVVGHMRPTRTREAWSFTVEDVAVNAVMAGALPEYLPVILALASTEITARHSSTSSFANMVVVNGPIRSEINMNWSTGALGPYNHANATIGRAYGLLSQNLQGGSTPGTSYMGSQGNNYAYNSLTFAENEEKSPWESFHVQKGFDPGESVVSVFTRVRSTSFQLGLREKHWREHLADLIRGMNPEAGVVFLLDPLAADLFVKTGGFKTKDMLCQWVHDNVRQKAGLYWDYQLVKNYIYPQALNGTEPFATWLKVHEDSTTPRFPLDQIHVVVVGGETNAYWRTMGCVYDKSVSIDLWR